jgi:hypothetical protein
MFWDVLAIIVLIVTIFLYIFGWMLIRLFENEAH